MNTALQQHWHRLSPATLPPAYRGGNLVFDHKQHQAVFVTARSTWLWNGSTWSQARSQSAPPARDSTHLVYDEARETILLFGGIGQDSSPLNDTWIWDGSTWTEQHPEQAPASRVGATLAYDTASGQVLLFGGLALGAHGTRSSNRTGTFLNDTWAWNGHSWTQRHTSTTPSKRAGAQLVCDEAHQQMLLLGGSNFTQGYLNDMWSWNGSDWNVLHLATFPPVQAHDRIVFHGQLHQVMLLAEGTGRSRQIWLWNGSSWSQHASNDAPGGSIEGLVYDAARRTTLAYVVSGGKPALPKKSSSSQLPDFPAPTLVSETWVWEE